MSLCKPTSCFIDLFQFFVNENMWEASNVSSSLCVPIVCFLRTQHGDHPVKFRPIWTTWDGARSCLWFWQVPITKKGTVLMLELSYGISLLKSLELKYLKYNISYTKICSQQVKMSIYSSKLLISIFITAVKFGPDHIMYNYNNYHGLTPTFAFLSFWLVFLLSF